MGALAISFAEPAFARLRWDLPSASVVHASDGMGLTNGSQSVHRVFSSRHGMLGSFTVYGVTYSWTRPAASSFLLAPWTYDSVVSCGQCHSWITSTDSSPAVGYPGLYETLRLDAAAADGMSSNAGQAVICEKCHDLVTAGTWSNSVHASFRHRGASGQCVKCHVQLPHGSGLPRLLGYAQNPSPYDTVDGGLAAFALKSYTPTSWGKRDCTSSCHTTGAGATAWPSGGSVGGTVRTSLGVPIAGATVTVGPLAATTGAAGTYRLDNIGVGYTTVRVTAPGYAGWAQSVTISGGTLLGVDPVLTAL